VKDRARSPLPWLAALLALYLLAPIVAFAVRLREGLSSAPGAGEALLTSLLTATVSMIVIAALGTPLAYLLARGRGVTTRVLGALVALPLALPPLMSGLLLLYLVGPNTAAGRLFDGKLTETRLAIVLAQTFVAAPFLVVAARGAFAALDPALEDVAASLGDGRFARFRRVAVPAALPGIGAGLLLAWLRAFGEFGATVILAYHPYSLPVFTFVQFDSTGLPATMLPVAAALGAALVLLLLTGAPLPRRRAPQGAAVPGPPARAPADGTLDFALDKAFPSGFSLRLAHRARSPRLALLGPSGAGKTLTLRLLAGLERSRGDAHVRLGSCELHLLAAERREVGYVPQHSALLPRRHVWRQVTFGRRARAELAAWWLGRLGLDGLEGRYPDELSGGQQRRVALARALAVEPRLLLLDEPFTGLDAPVRDRLRRELRALQRESSLCTVIVTHDPEEAAMLADEIIVLGDGRILQAGKREEVFARPHSAQVARLLGIANTRTGTTVGANRVLSYGAEIEAPTDGLPPGSEIEWCVRPEQIELDANGRYEALVLDTVDLGAVRELTISLGDRLELTLRTSERTGLSPRERARVNLEPALISVWPARAGEAAAAGRE
jgi:molybdate transport system ATP-binding protein/molybdate transport system permease protein